MITLAKYYLYWIMQSKIKNQLFFIYSLQIRFSNETQHFPIFNLLGCAI